MDTLNTLLTTLAALDPLVLVFIISMAAILLAFHCINAITRGRGERD